MTKNFPYTLRLISSLMYLDDILEVEAKFEDGTYISLSSGSLVVGDKTRRIAISKSKTGHKICHQILPAGNVDVIFCEIKGYFIDIIVDLMSSNSLPTQEA